MPYSSFRVSHHKIKYVVYVCLLLISKWNGVMAKATLIENKSSYPVTSFSTPQIKYHVFVSFRGPDIRQGFLSHLIRAFSQENIVVFVDYDIPKGDEISHSLLGAIEGSLISLIIFSQNYASSSWCLIELVKILECRKKDGQIVLPIFFKVDPSDVRYQKGTYRDAFVKHERKYSLITTQRWRFALNESANIAGFHSSTFRNEAELVKDIVKCVLMRLSHMHQVNSKGLNRIGKRIAYVESLLQLEAADVRIIGICGMGGINKTVIAQEIYNKVGFEYEGCCFLTNIREEFGRHGIISLKQKLFSTLLGEKDLKIDTPNGLPQYVKKRIGRMKVLIVLDDVDESELKNIVGTHEWFGSGSRIIITTRNKCVLSEEFSAVYEGIYLLIALSDVEDNSNQLLLSYDSSNETIINASEHEEQNKLFGESNKTEGNDLMQKKQKIEFSKSYISPETKLERKLKDIYIKKESFPWIIKKAMKPLPQAMAVGPSNKHLEELHGKWRWVQG